MNPQQLQKKLRTSSKNAMLFYLEGMEFGEIEPWQSKAVDIFEEMSASISEIPAPTLASALWHRERLGTRAFNRHFDQGISAVGRVSFPKNATEFLDLLILGFDQGP